MASISFIFPPRRVTFFPMNQSWNREFVGLVETIIGAPEGTTPFWTTVAIAVGTLVLAGWFVANFVCSARKGIVVSFFAHTVPAAAAACGWIAARLYLVPDMAAGPLRDFLPLAAAMAAILVVSFFTTRSWLGISEGGSVVAIALTYACVAAAILLGGSLAREMDSSLRSLEAEKQQREADTQLLVQ